MDVCTLRTGGSAQRDPSEHHHMNKAIRLARQRSEMGMVVCECRMPAGCIIKKLCTNERESPLYKCIVQWFVLETDVMQILGGTTGGWGDGERGGPIQFEQNTRTPKVLMAICTYSIVLRRDLYSNTLLSAAHVHTTLLSDSKNMRIPFIWCNIRHVHVVPVYLLYMFVYVYIIKAEHDKNNLRFGIRYQMGRWGGSLMAKSCWIWQIVSRHINYSVLFGRRRSARVATAVRLVSASCAYVYKCALGLFCVRVLCGRSPRWEMPSVPECAGTLEWLQQQRWRRRRRRNNDDRKICKKVELCVCVHISETMLSGTRKSANGRQRRRRLAGLFHFFFIQFELLMVQWRWSLHSWHLCTFYRSVSARSVCIIFVCCTCNVNFSKNLTQSSGMTHSWRR